MNVSNFFTAEKIKYNFKLYLFLKNLLNFEALYPSKDYLKQQEVFINLVVKFKLSLVKAQIKLALSYGLQQHTDSFCIQNHNYVHIHLYAFLIIHRCSYTGCSSTTVTKFKEVEKHINIFSIGNEGHNPVIQS